MARHALILLNPNARRGATAVSRAAESMRQRLVGDEDQHWVVTCRATDFTVEPRQDETRLVLDWIAEREASATIAGARVIVVSGDGGMAKVVLALADRPDLRRDLEFGFLPMGNANVLARENGIAWDDVSEAIEQVMAGHTNRMDVGTIDGVPRFLLMLDVGYFARVVGWVDAVRSRRGTRWMYRLSGDLCYGIAGALEALRLWPVRFELEVDGAPIPGRFVALAVANVGVYAKNWFLCPDARPDDGELDFNGICLARSVLRYTYRAARVRRPSAAISTVGVGRTFTIRAGAGLRCQIDGDPLPGKGQRELRVGVDQGFYALITPDPPRRRL